MTDRYYIIKAPDLMTLLHNSYILRALDKGEVDEWDKYTSSIFNFEKENGSIEDLVYEKLKCYHVLRLED